MDKKELIDSVTNASKLIQSIIVSVDDFRETVRQYNRENLQGYDPAFNPKASGIRLGPNASEHAFYAAKKIWESTISLHKLWQSKSVRNLYEFANDRPIRIIHWNGSYLEAAHILGHNTCQIFPDRDKKKSTGSVNVFDYELGELPFSLESFAERFSSMMGAYFILGVGPKEEYDLREHLYCIAKEQQRALMLIPRVEELGIALESLELVDPKSKPIPQEYRSVPLSRTQIARFHSGKRQANPSQYVSRLVKSGLIQIEGKKGGDIVVDIRDFPATAQPELLGKKNI